jgi:predicted secreted protein
MKNLTVEFKAVGQAVKAATKATEKAGDARHVLAIELHNNAINLNNAETAAGLKLEIQKCYPNGVGKDADPIAKKQVQAIRQVVATYKKGASLNLSPNNFDTYSQYRNECYKAQSKTKLETIQGWIDSETIDLTLEDLTALIASYKAIEA